MAYSSPGVMTREGRTRIGTLRAAEKGLVTLNVARSSSEIDGKPWRYQPRPPGRTKRTRSVMYVTAVATDVFRDSGEQRRPIVVVARHVVAMIRKKANKDHHRRCSSGSRT